MGIEPPTTRWRKRPPVRLTVRTLMIFVLVFGGGLGWVVHRARVQRDAAAAIERTGGSVVYVWGRSSNGVTVLPTDAEGRSGWSGCSGLITLPTSA